MGRKNAPVNATMDEESVSVLALSLRGAHTIATMPSPHVCHDSRKLIHCSTLVA